ncbi:DNA mismatch repair endonuclease MutL [uncultured Cytophaga sp.]|uniref:DNA mismatch repair endonuclease MutL n=1 Tax=uncultured Cytophaga sp. TaxID=160238 RepID=UPI0026117748|nr:DNA mismatch repair endonuclease MutL [uncultured Cytophaga sp.]
MSDIIRLLPDNIANQIAAGEVVQRPASVVKELLENSVDAGSTSVQLIVKDAGKQLVQVIDNGKGMTDSDARLCFERHATSKIRSAEDLFAIKTFGFRGEAMASIAAVAQVELKTKQAENELGTLIRIEGSSIIVHEQTAHPVGTSISVKNLFYNIPARRNFLKSNSVEMRHIMDEFVRVALAYPHVAFSFYHNDLELFNLPEEILSKRAVSLLGGSYREQLIPCKEETDFVSISGYIGKPESARKTRGDQFFFVNNRFIKSHYLNHAVMHAFEELIPGDSFPFYILYIEIDPSNIDVNVHPTKTEIKFDDEKTVYAIIKACVKRSLGTHNIMPSLDFDFNVNVSGFTGLSANNDSNTNEYKEFTTKPFASQSSTERSNQSNWERMYSGMENNREEVYQESIKMLSAINGKEDVARLDKELLHTENTSTFQLHQKYIVTQIKSGMMLVDQQAAHERILFEKYIGMLQNKFGSSQQFLFPQTLELSASDFALVLEMEDDIRKLGFVFNVFSNTTIVVNGVPSDVKGGNEKDLFEGLIEQFKQNRTDLKIDRQENLARALAKRSAIRAGNKLTLVEMNSIIDQLFACKTPNFAPDGNLTVVMLDMDKIGRLFM